MLTLYKNHLLSVLEVNTHGVYLDGEEHKALHLPKAPEGTRSGDELEVYLYRTSEGRVVATKATSHVQIGECAYLKVVAKGEHGAFLGWGLPKDLLLPNSEQIHPVREGCSYVVYTYFDKSQRPIATTKLHRHLNESQGNLKIGESVDLIVSSQSELGFKAVINNQQLGLIYFDELSQPLTIGSKLKGWVKAIRDDGKIDLNINVLDQETRDQLETAILEKLQQSGGRLAISDKSSPETIFKTFNVSKKNFKRALGGLYKQRLININTSSIELVSSSNKE